MSASGVEGRLSRAPLELPGSQRPHGARRRERVREQGAEMRSAADEVPSAMIVIPAEIEPPIPLPPLW